MTNEDAKDYIREWCPYDKQEEIIEALSNSDDDMTVEQYRARMIEAFHNADCDHFIALVSLPTEKEFEHLEWLLKNHYKKKSNSDEDRCCEVMKFPNTFDEFAEQYGFTDKEEHYTNGLQLIPVFRVKQWLEHLQSNSDEDCIKIKLPTMEFEGGDCISREALLKTIKLLDDYDFIPAMIVKGLIEKAPSIQPKSIEGDAISRTDAEMCLTADITDMTIEEYISMVGDRLKGLPSIQPKKVGHWVEVDHEPHEVWECDRCGKSVFVDARWDVYEDYKYCPNCGTMMEKEKTDKEQIKSAMEGFTSFMRAICNNNNLGVPKEMADEFGISEEFRRNEE